MLDAGRSDIWPRDLDEFGSLFGGLDLVEPGIALATQWRPADDSDKSDPKRVSMYAAVARR